MRGGWGGKGGERRGGGEGGGLERTERGAEEVARYYEKYGYED